jgi:hypothetical protein
MTTNRTSGVGLYSPAVFDFNKYLIEHEIDSNNVLFLTWGLYAQPYFLQKGDFQIKQFAYQLIEKPARKEKEEFLKQLFTSVRALPRESDSLYFPLWAHYWTDTNDALVEFVDDHGGQISVEKIFEEKLGGNAILLYRLDGVGDFVSQFHREVIDTEVSPNLNITRFGPTRITADKNADLPMWFIAEGLTPHTRVGLQGLLLKTVYSNDHVTALVPHNLIRKPGFYPLLLYDPLSGYRSEVVLLHVE